MTRVSSTTANGVLSLLSAVLLLSALPQHIRVRNTGTLLMIGWLFLGNVSQAITSFALQDTQTDLTRLLIQWCDFAAAVQYVFPFGFSAGMLILLQKLESIASTRQVSQTSSSKRRALIWQLVLGIAAPLLLVPLRLIVQGHRMNIIAGYNCNAPLYASVPALFLSQLPPFILSTVNLVFAAIVLRWFILRRRQFAALLHSSGTGISKRRYVRLMTLALVEILVSWPVALWVLIYNAKFTTFAPYHSWGYVHEDFDQVYLIDYDTLSIATQASVEIARWLAVAVAFIFFAFFGLTAEAWCDAINSGKKMLRMLSRSTTQQQSGVASDVNHLPKSSSFSSHLELGIDDIPKTPESDWVSMTQLQTKAILPRASEHVFISSERVITT